MINIGIGIPFGQRSAGIDPQAKIAFDSLQSAGFTTPQGITGINAAFKTIKTIYGTSDITTAISFFGDPSLAYEAGAGSGTTLGQAIRTLPNIIDPTRATDAVQTTAASQPLLLTHTTGNNYWFGSGVSGNFVSTPNAAANNIVNDFDIKITATYIFNSTFNAYIGKWDSGQQSWRLYLGSDNRLVWNIQGQSLFPSSVAINSTMNHLRVTRQSSNGEIKYFYSTQPLSTSLESITWVQLGITQMGVTGSAPTTTSSLRIGQEQGNPFNGKIYRVTLANSIDGAPVVDFNPNQYNPSNSQTQWTSSTGEVWTINTGTATSGYKGVLVNRTTMQGDGVDDGLAPTSNFILSRNATTYTAFKVFEITGANKSILSLGNNPNEIDIRQNTNRINNVIMFLPNTSFRFAAMQRNETALQGIANLNGGSDITNTIAAIGTNLNRVYFFQNIFNQNGNGIITTHITNTNIDTLSQKTAMYNYIRSINNNAF